jgi:Protein of unknown function (DUF3175)
MPAKTTAKKRRSTSARRGTKSPRKWSAGVMRKSDALDLKQDTFKARDPKKIARLLKKSAEESKRRKGTPYQSAMSMLNFYINRGGRNLSESRKKILEKAKGDLRKLFGRE